MIATQTRSVLMVEDNLAFVNILEYLVKPWQLEVVSTSSALKAESLILARPFDLYLIDLQLSDGDAATLIARLSGMGTAISSRSLIVTAFPIVASGLGLPVVDKTKLASLGTHLVRILGAPAAA